jgi:hypothetical protein
MVAGRSSTIRRLGAAAVAVGAMAGATLVAAEPASAGISRCIGIWANDGRLKLQHIHGCGPNGTYHIEVWSPGRHTNGAPYTYVGRLREFQANWPVPDGTNVCAQLWRHKPGGGYDSWGLPCDRM